MVHVVRIRFVFAGSSFGLHVYCFAVADLICLLSRRRRARVCVCARFCCKLGSSSVEANLHSARYPANVCVDQGSLRRIDMQMVSLKIVGVEQFCQATRMM